MAALTKAIKRAWHGEVGLRIEPKVGDNIKIWAGACLGFIAASKLVRGLVDGDAFAGFAFESCDNTETGHTAGGKRVVAFAEGVIVLTVAGVDGTDDIGKTVYATTDNDFSITDSGTDTAIGKIEDLEPGGAVTLCRVSFKASHLA